MALRLRSEELKRELAARMSGQDFDVIQAEGIEMASHILSIPRGKMMIVFDDHNAEYVLQRRAFETDARLPSRWPAALYSLVQWRKLRNYERRVCHHADRVVVCSEADRLAVEELAPELSATVIPNGVDTDHYQPGDEEIPNRLVFTGKMDFRPNVDAVLWLYEEVFPRLRDLVPGVHLCVAGKNPHRRLSYLRRDPQVTLTGQVPDIRPYISRAALYVVPLRIGGGTRLKVLEAMATGKAVLSTSLGCEGLDVTPSRDIVIADAPEDFALRAAELLGDGPTRKALGERARELVENHYDWRAIIPRFETVYAR
jgi:glycosyltransferase involved in cell wall biosynthesis